MRQASALIVEARRSREVELEGDSRWMLGWLRGRSRAGAAKRPWPIVAGRRQQQREEDGDRGVIGLPPHAVSFIGGFRTPAPGLGACRELGERAGIRNPSHLRASDPGRIEGKVVFTYLDAFDEDGTTVSQLKERYVRGGLGDSVVKKRLDGVLQALLAPIRERRSALERDPGYVLDIVKHGTARSREITDSTLREVRAALGLFTLN